MNVKSFEPMLRDATIKALDSVGEKFAGADVVTKNAVPRLLSRWNALDREEKENIASIVIATAITAVSALGALKRRKKSVARRVMKKISRR